MSVEVDYGYSESKGSSLGTYSMVRTGHYGNQNGAYRYRCVTVKATPRS